MIFWDVTYYGNTLQRWIFALLIMVAVLVVLETIKKILERRLIAFAERTDNDWDDQIANLIKRTNFWFLLILSVYIASQILILPAEILHIMSRVMIIALLIQMAFWGNDFISYLISRYLRLKSDDGDSVVTVPALGLFSRIGFYTLIILLILDNLGMEIDTLIAGLGIGGIAVALAAQNILGDLFGSLSILLDKPFVIGDFIIIDNYMGTVEHIGLKSTRIRSLSGEQLVFSNHDLLGSRIRNYQQMQERRIVQTLGVIYQTSYEKLVLIPSIIKEIIDAQDKVRFDRAHFSNYGAFSLDFEIVYYILSPDYTLYMDIQQAINLAIFRRFEEEGIEFAYPTQTLFLNK